MKRIISTLLALAVTGCQLFTDLDGYSWYSDTDSDTSSSSQYGTGSSDITVVDSDADTSIDSGTDTAGDTDSQTDISTDTSSNEDTGPAPKIEVVDVASGDVLDAGSLIEIGDVLIEHTTTRIFEVRNLGNANLTVSGIDAYRDISSFTVADAGALPATVSPEGSFQIFISCHPIMKETVVLEFSIKNSDSKNSDFRLMMRANGVYKPVIQVRLGNSSGEILSDGQTVFANPVSVGSTEFTTFYIENMGNVPLWLQSVTTDNNLYFAPFDFSEATIAPSPTIDGKYQEVRFSSDSSGQYHTDIAFFSDDPETPFFHIDFVGIAN